MQPKATVVTIASAPTSVSTDWPELRQQRRVIVVVDVVESVRLMQANEADVIDRWRRFVNEVRTQVLPKHGGRLVKSLGDGLLLEFESVTEAVACALTIQQRIAPINDGRDALSAMYLRIGVHVADVVVDDLDVYGSGVNLAARLTTLAGPGEIVVSAEVRDGLTDGLDSHVTDLGERFLKHLTSAVRAYRIADPVGVKRVEALTLDDLLPTIAVVPFSCMRNDQRHLAMGDALADDVIAALSRSSGLKVVARLSTNVFRRPLVSLPKIRSHLGAAYALCGSYSIEGDHLRLRAELCDTRDSKVLWADALTGSVTDVFQGQDSVVSTLVAEVSRYVLATELRRARQLPVSSLHDYTLYVASVSMLHRLSAADFRLARDLLEHLVERHPRSAAPLAMLAKWHFFRMVQGWTSSVELEAAKARGFAQQALSLDSGHAFALAIDALVMAHSHADLDAAQRRCSEAIAADPQEPFAWLVMAGLHSYSLDARAETMALRAVELSPLDPAKFMFDVFVGAGKLACGKFDEAIAWARSSLRLNAMHLSSHRLLVIALSLNGMQVQARDAGLSLMTAHPDFRVNDYARRYPGRDMPHASAYMNALRASGIPN